MCAILCHLDSDFLATLLDPTEPQREPTKAEPENIAEVVHAQFKRTPIDRTDLPEELTLLFRYLPFSFNYQRAEYNRCISDIIWRLLSISWIFLTYTLLKMLNHC